jgi:hypothetical protein
MWRPFLRFTAISLLTGAATGATLLGAGGRFAMYLFAVATDRASVFTVGGSLNVVFAGAIAGTVGGLLLALTRRFLPRLLLRRGLLFAALCYVIAIPGLRPPRLLVFALFAPLFLAYGMLTVWLADRVPTPPPSNTRLKLTAPGI